MIDAGAVDAVRGGIFVAFVTGVICSAVPASLEEGSDRGFPISGTRVVKYYAMGMATGCLRASMAMLLCADATGVTMSQVAVSSRTSPLERT